MSSTRSGLYSFWLPTPSVAFRWLLVPRLLGAFFMHISDCDETYNYWEPVRVWNASFRDTVTLGNEFLVLL